HIHSFRRCPHAAESSPVGVVTRYFRSMVNADNVLVIPGPSDPWHTGSLVGFDLETTGPNPHEARIVTASIVLMDPDGQMRANAADVQGVSTEHTKAHCMDPTQGLTEIVATLQDFMHHRVPIVAYNGVYDFTVLANELARRDMDEAPVVGVIDPFVLDKYADT